MSFVVDASVALGWLLPSQSSAPAASLLQRALLEGMVVPPLWHIEVANQLGLKLRVGKLSQEDFLAASQLLEELAIETDRKIWTSKTELVNLMNTYELTAYDAIYLELATRRNLSLATFDKELIAAARQANVALLP
jgi:predicted nucleic acid-binding protein